MNLRYTRLDRTHLLACCASIAAVGLPQMGAEALAIIGEYLQRVRPGSDLIVGDDLWHYLDALCGMRDDAEWKRAILLFARAGGLVSDS